MQQPSIKKMLRKVPFPREEKGTYPFEDSWSASLQRELEIKFCWTVETMPFRAMRVCVCVT